MYDYNDIQFLHTFNNALANATYDRQIYASKIVEKKEIAENTWYISAIVNNHLMIPCVAYAISPYEFKLFFTLEATRILLIDPLLEDVKRMVTDFYKVGHNL
jgi:hypothetical protein